MSDEPKGVITILEDGRTVATWAAPFNSYAARQLWVFLVENLRPGLEVTLNHEHVRLRRNSGQEVPIELYKRVMEDQEDA